MYTPEEQTPKSLMGSVTPSNEKVATKFEAANSGQGCLGLAIVSAFTIFGVIIGFGFFSIFTGVGGFIVGGIVAAPFMRDNPEKVAYEQRKVRISEIESLLSQIK